MILRWTARLLGMVLLAIFCAFFLGEGHPPFLPLSVATMESYLLMLSLAGLLVALRYEALGGMLGMAGCIGFYLADFAASGCHRLPGGWVFPLLFVTPALYLLTWWRERTGA